MLNRLLIVCIVALALNADAQQSGGSLREEYIAYIQACDELKRHLNTSENQATALRDFNETWLNRFLNALGSLSGSDTDQVQVLSEVMALQTSLGKCEDAIRSNQALLKFHIADDLALQLRMNLAEIYYGEWLKSPTDDLLKASDASFSAAFAKLEGCPPTAQTLSFIQQYGQFLCRSDRPLEAAKVYDFASEMLAHASDTVMQGLPREAQPGVLSSYSQEWFLSEAAKQAYKAGDLNKSNSKFVALIHLDKLVRPASYYYLDRATYVDPTYGSKFRLIAQEGLKNAKYDVGTDQLNFYLARSFFMQQDYVAAAKLYTDLLRMPLISGELKSTMDIRPYATEVVRNLATCLTAMGEQAEADNLTKSYNIIHN